MEKITRKPLSEIPSLRTLHENWEQWGKEYKERIDQSKGKAVSFSWRLNLYPEILKQLGLLTVGHCSFCDIAPLGAGSRETIEHYEPKTEFPLVAYQWDNLYYCCDVCQAASNRQPSYNATLRPDATDYAFDRYFYYDNEHGEVKVMENLSEEESRLANLFLARYGIDTNATLKQVRKNEYMNICNALRNPDDGRIRDDFSFRWIYDFAMMEMRI